MEHEDQKNSPTKPFFVTPAPNWFLIRSMTESFPRKGDFSRLILSGLHRCQATGGDPARQMYLYAPEIRYDEQLLSSHFPETTLMILPGPAPDLISLLIRENQETISLALHTSKEPVLNETLKELSMVFSGFQPQNRTRLIQELWSRGARESLESLAGPHTRDTVIIPEKTGKMRLWSMASGFREHITKKYKHYRFDPVVFPASPGADTGIPTEAGSGIACCLFLSQKIQDAYSQRRIWSTTIDLKDKGVSLQAPGLFCTSLVMWFQSLEGRLSENMPGKIYMINPDWMLNYVFREHLLNSWPDGNPLTFMFPDLLLGWSPELSFLQFITEQSSSVFFLDFRNFPEIRCVYSEKGARNEH